MGGVGNQINRVSNYKSYVALLTQEGTDAPQAIVLENTIGDVSYGRFSDGHYVVISDNLFTLDKTCCILSGSKSSDVLFLVTDINSSSDSIEIKSYDNFFNPTDGFLSSTLIEIRVYN